MEEKWFVIAIAVWLFASFGGMAYSDYVKGECRIAYSKTQWSAEDIIKVCK